jgi:hypothetical protein
MKRDAGLCREICALSRSTSGAAPAARPRASQHGEQQRHQQGRAALPATSPSATITLPSGIGSTS